MLRIVSTLMLLGVASISAYAQSAQPLRADVPFAFTVQETILPAGTYQFTYNNTAHTLSIRGLGRNSVGAFVTAEPTSAVNSSNERARLTFHCYGKSCYLAQAWHGSSTGLKVRETAHERRLALATRAVSITIPAKRRRTIGQSLIVDEA